MAIIRVRGLVKEFHRRKRSPKRFGALRTWISRKHTVVRAVDGVDFNIEPGELVGYIGPNGAGKSTTIKLLTGVLVPTYGDVEVAGIVPWRDRERNARQIGVVFGQRTGLWWDLPLADSFRLMGTLYGVPRQRFRANLDEVTDLLGLDEFIDTPVRELSLGQRMRGDLAAAMLHEPKILYLDEPTIGLDVAAKSRIRTLIARLNRDLGTTILLSTHDIADVEQLCTRLILIDHGRVLYDGGIAQFKARYAPHRELVVRLADPVTEIDVPGVNSAQINDGVVVLRFDPARVAVVDLISRVLAVRQVTDVTIGEPKLEGVIAKIYADRSG